MRLKFSRRDLPGFEENFRSWCTMENSFELVSANFIQNLIFLTKLIKFSKNGKTRYFLICPIFNFNLWNSPRIIVFRPRNSKFVFNVKKPYALQTNPIRTLIFLNLINILVKIPNFVTDFGKKNPIFVLKNVKMQIGWEIWKIFFLLSKKIRSRKKRNS